MNLSPGEFRGRFAFAAVMVAVGLAPFIFLVVQAARTQSHGLSGSSGSPAVHPSAMIETTLLLVGGLVLALTTFIEARRGANR